jgi:hypothetical protein
LKYFVIELVETLTVIRTKKLEEGSIARVDDCCPQHWARFECIKNMNGICLGLGESESLIKEKSCSLSIEITTYKIKVSLNDNHPISM